MTVSTPLKALIQGAYDVQDLRVSMGNRITQCFYQAHGVAPGEKPAEKLDAENKKLLARIKSEYKGVAAGLTKRPKKDTFKSTEYLPDFIILQLCALHDGLLEQEKAAFDHVDVAVRDIPIYQHFLKSVTGCGPAMSGVLLSTLDIHKAERPSQFWAYAGLDVVLADGRGRSRRKEHLVKREYTDRKGEVETRLGITFNPFLKTKLFVLASCFMRNHNPYYRAIYDGYKHRLENRPDWKDKTPGHRNNAARRYMIKMFLTDLWREWRTLEGLPVVEPYAVDKLGLHHHRAA